jgi:hypothetical protein
MMADVDRNPPVTLNELVISSLATADALTNFSLRSESSAKTEFLKKGSEKRRVFHGKVKSGKPGMVRFVSTARRFHACGRDTPG